MFFDNLCHEISSDLWRISEMQIAELSRDWRLVDVSGTVDGRNPAPVDK